ncbi:MAG: hypothetical protein AAFO75_03900 [Pseudomonadota bacterium]
MKSPHRRAHRWIWGLLTLLIPAILATALYLQQSRFETRPAVLLEAPSSKADKESAQP